MTLYNTTFLDTSTNLLQLATGVNDIKPGWYGGFLIFALYIVTLAIFNDRNPANIILIDSFLVSFIAVLMFTADLIGFQALAVPMILLFFSIIAKVWGDSG